MSLRCTKPCKRVDLFSQGPYDLPATRLGAYGNNYLTVLLYERKGDFLEGNKAPPPPNQPRSRSRSHDNQPPSPARGRTPCPLAPPHRRRVLSGLECIPQTYLGGFAGATGKSIGRIVNPQGILSNESGQNLPRPLEVTHLTENL